jgi:hypothetical protein
MKCMKCRGIDAPETSMPYGREAKEELTMLVQGKRLKISVYGNDRYSRLVGDVDCNGVFVQVRNHIAVCLGPGVLSERSSILKCLGPLVL